MMAPFPGKLLENEENYPFQFLHYCNLKRTYYIFH